MGCIDAQLLKVLDRGRSKQIASNSCHHEHISATKPGCNRLIRALAAESEIKFLAEDGFAGLGEAIREGCQVDIGAANHRNARASGHRFLQRTLRTPSLFGCPDCVNGDGVATAAENCSSRLMTYLPALFR